MKIRILADDALRHFCTAPSQSPSASSSLLLAWIDWSCCGIIWTQSSNKIMTPGWTRSSQTFPTLIAASLQQGPSSHFRLKDQWDFRINSWNFLSKNYLVLWLKVIKSHHKKRRNLNQIWILGSKMFLLANPGLFFLFLSFLFSCTIGR